MEGAPFLLPSDLQQLLPQVSTILKEGGREGEKEDVVMGREGGKEERGEEEVKDLMVTLGAVLSFVLRAAKAMREGGREGGKKGWCTQEQDGKENEQQQQQQQQQQLHDTQCLLQKCLLALPPFLSHLLHKRHRTQRLIQREILKFLAIFEEEEEEEEEEGGKVEGEWWSMVRLTAEVLMMEEKGEERDGDDGLETEGRKEALSSSFSLSSSSSSSSSSSCEQVSDWWAALLGVGAVTPLVVEEAWLALLHSASLPSPSFPSCPVKKKEDEGEGKQLLLQQQQEWRAAARKLVESYDRSAIRNHFLYFGRLRAAAFL